MSINYTQSSTTYRPDESNVEIFSEHTWLQGAFLATAAYGIQSILYFMSVRLLWISRQKNKRRNTMLTTYITTLFTLGTLYIAGLLQFTQQSFIDDRNIQGGPNTYENIMFSIPIDMLANVIMVLLTWMCDIINVWRCTVIYRGARVPWYLVMIIPGMMYLASIATGMLFLKQVGTVNASPWATNGINWTTPYYSMSLSLNVLITLLIVLRLLACRAQINRVLGNKHGAQYTSLVAIIVESAAIYSTFSLLFLVPFVVNTPVSVAVSQLFLQALSPIQVVSTLLIIFRVAQGRAWTSATTNTMTDTSGGGGATHTIGGHSIHTATTRGPIHIHTHTVTNTGSSFTNTSNKEHVALETISDKTRTVNFSEADDNASSV